MKFRFLFPPEGFQLFSLIPVSPRGIMGQRGASAVGDLLASDPDGRKLSANASEYFGSRRGWQKLLINHLIKRGLDRSDGECARDGKPSLDVGQLFFDALKSFVGSKQCTSPVRRTDRMAEGSAASSGGAGGVAR